jgi:uncharacterized protein (TIGR02145 family)
MKNNILFYPLITIEALLMLIISCKKDDNNPGNLTNDKTQAVFNSSLTYGTMTDQDGNIYRTITIGTQTWMAENLRTTKYRNGDAIPEVTDNTVWTNSITGAYCNYKNTKNNDTIATFGRLYNWFSVSDSRNIAPSGWHVPTEDEWTTLITYLGFENTGGKLKELGTAHWGTPNTGAENSNGFTALPGGSRGISGKFDKISDYGYWWSSSEFYYNKNVAWYRYINYNSSDINKYYISEWFGFSVRCLKDN